MPFAKLEFRPGLVRDTTSYTNEGGWFDSDKIRFRSNLPQKIGGWVKKSIYSFLGLCRGLHTFVELGGTTYRLGRGEIFAFSLAVQVDALATALGLGRQYL